MKDLFAAHDALLIASPEYNGLLTPLLKNTLDWVSRRGPDDAAKRAYEGKIAAIISASPGRFGGLRGLSHIRTLLTNLGVLVVAKQAAVSSAARAFDDSGQLANETDARVVRAVVEQLVAHTMAMHKARQ